MTPDDDISASPLCRVVCAAIRHKETKAIIAGVRHYDPVMRGVILAMFNGDPEAARAAGWWSCEQGFVTNVYDHDAQTYQFVTREQAWRIAEKAGQILPRKGQQPDYLYSEDIH